MDDTIRILEESLEVIVKFLRKLGIVFHSFST